MDSSCEVVFFGNVNSVKMLKSILDEVGNISLHLLDITNVIRTKKPEYDSGPSSVTPTGYITSYFDTDVQEERGICILISEVYSDIEIILRNIAKAFNLKFLYKLEDYTNMIFINNDIRHVEFQSRFLVYFDDARDCDTYDTEIYDKFEFMEWEYFHCEEAVKEWFRDNVELECETFYDLLKAAYGLGFEIIKYDYKNYYI